MTKQYEVQQYTSTSCPLVASLTPFIYSHYPSVSRPHHSCFTPLPVFHTYTPDRGRKRSRLPHPHRPRRPRGRLRISPPPSWSTPVMGGHWSRLPCPTPQPQGLSSRRVCRDHGRGWEATVYLGGASCVPACDSGG